MITTNTWFLLINIALVDTITSVDIECNFKSDDFDAITDQYICDVRNNLMINSKNVVIQMFRGSHKFGKTSSDVTGLSINDKKIQFMPENFGNKFKNLIAIKIRQGRLKEISQNDLKAFPKLRYLNLDANDIESLDDELFEFNPQLETIWFEGNRIKNTGMSVFSNLKNLNDLDLNGNVCISKRMSNSREMAEFLAEVKKNCFDAGVELVKFKQKYKTVNRMNPNILSGSDMEITNNVSMRNPQMLVSNKDIEIEEFQIVILNLTELVKTKEKEAEEKISKLQLEINHVKNFEEKVANVTTEKNQAYIELSKCQNKSKEIENQNLNFTAENTEKTNKIFQLESQLIDLQVTYSQSIEKYENLSIENKKFTETLNSTEFRLKHIDDETLPGELDEKIKKYLMLDNQLKKRETDLKKFELEVASTISTLTKSKEKIENILKHKNQEIVKKDNEIRKLRATNAQFHNKNNQLQYQLKDIKLRSEERKVKADITYLQELNTTKELLEIEKLKFQDLEAKFNTTLENKTMECSIHQDLQTSNQLQRKLEDFDKIQMNLGNSSLESSKQTLSEAQKCPELPENIQSIINMKNNRIKGLILENKQLKFEKATLLTRQGKLNQILRNKTYECSQEIVKTKDLKNIIILNDADINELLAEKSQLKNEINILNDSEERMKNSLKNKYGSCYYNLEKLNQELKNASRVEHNLKENIAVYQSIIKTNNSTISNLINEANQLRNQTKSISGNSDSKLNTTIINFTKVNQELKDCTLKVSELQQKNLQLEDYINNQEFDDYTSIEP